jgi:hypothetical protein
MGKREHGQQKIHAIPVHGREHNFYIRLFKNLDHYSIFTPANIKLYT